MGIWISAIAILSQGPMTAAQAEGRLSAPAGIFDRKTGFAILTAKDLRPWLAAKKPEAARFALEEAGRRGDVRFASAVVDRLGRGEASVREAAATSLGKIGGPIARRALLSAAQDSSPVQRYAIGRALDALGDRQAAVPGLIDGAELGHYAAIRRLRTLRDRRAAAPLESVARRPNFPFAEEAMLAAAVSGSLSAKRTLRAWAVDSQSWRHRWTAATGLRILAMPEDANRLAKLQTDANRDVRRAALP